MNNVSKLIIFLGKGKGKGSTISQFLKKGHVIFGLQARYFSPKIVIIKIQIYNHVEKRYNLFQQVYIFSKEYFNNHGPCPSRHGPHRILMFTIP